MTTKGLFNDELTVVQVLPFWKWRRDEDAIFNVNRNRNFIARSATRRLWTVTNNGYSVGDGEEGRGKWTEVSAINSSYIFHGGTIALPRPHNRHKLRKNTTTV